MKIIVFLAAILFVGCTDEVEARRVLDDQGFTDIHITGYRYAACARDDQTHTGFTAKNAQGKPVSGVVCCGLVMKSCTIRW